jgi:hypothetical protein
MPLPGSIAPIDWIPPGRHQLVFVPGLRLQPFYGIVEATREPDAYGVWADTQAFCNFGLRIPLEPPTADLPGIGIHQLEQLFENQAIVDLFRVGEDAPRIREIFQKQILRRYQLPLALDVFIDQPFVGGPQIFGGIGDRISLRCMRGGFDGLLEFFVTRRYTIDFVHSVAGQHWSDFLGGFENAFIERLTSLVSVMKPKLVMSHGTRTIACETPLG